MNALTRLVLGPGRMPEQLRARLTTEGLILLDEGLVGSITWRDYRAPGEYASWRRRAVSGTVGISNQSVVVFAGRAKRIDLPLRHPRRSAVEVKVEVTVEAPDQVTFSHDAACSCPTGQAGSSTGCAPTRVDLQNWPGGRPVRGGSHSRADGQSAERWTRIFATVASAPVSFRTLAQTW